MIRELTTLKLAKEHRVTARIAQQVMLALVLASRALTPQTINVMQDIGAKRDLNQRLHLQHPSMESV